MPDEPDAPEEGDHRLLMSFLDQSPSFAYGFTCGRIWQQMADGEDLIEGVVLVEVRPQIEAMAMELGWIEEFEVIDAHWLRVKLTNPN